MVETLQGWINLYKPKNISSFFAMKKIQSKFQIKKIGHCGTLDPLAEGILPIAIGKTTKLIPFVIKNEKKYIFSIKWGKQTSTDDLEGRVIGNAHDLTTEKFEILKPKLEPHEKLSKSLTHLIELAKNGKLEECYKIMTTIVPEYKKTKVENLQNKRVVQEN